MRTTRRLKITVTTTRREITKTIVNTITRELCPYCQRVVMMVSGGQAAAQLATDASDLTQLIIDGYIHLVLTASGSLLICQDSLLQVSTVQIKS